MKTNLKLAPMRERPVSRMLEFVRSFPSCTWERNYGPSWAWAN